MTAPTSGRLTHIGIAALFVVGCLAVGWISGTAGDASSAWYQGLEQPAFQPPDWLFAPVWTVLYILMGIAAFLVWRQGFGRADVRLALALFAVQLALNAAWTPTFFGAESVAGGLAVIIALLIALAATLWQFLRVHRLAGYLLIPYLLWVAYATALNLAILILN